MPLEPLHVHSGRLSWNFQVRRFFVRLTIAEDPSKPVILRTWARATRDGKEHEMFFFKLSKSVREFDDGERQSAFNMTLGPIVIWFALINKN